MRGVGAWAAAVACVAFSGCSGTVTTSATTPGWCGTGYGPECCEGDTIPVHIAAESRDGGAYAYDLSIPRIQAGGFAHRGHVDATPGEAGHDAVDIAAAAAGTYTLWVNVTDGRHAARAFSIECPDAVGVLGISATDVALGWSVR
jgi:hypothetical protein